MRTRSHSWLLALLLLGNACLAKDAPMRVKDLGKVQGWRENVIVGTGVVTGLAGTGDSPSSRATRQALANVLSQFNLTIAPEQINSRNVAVVIVSASLPAFARPGDTLDVSVSSSGHLRSPVVFDDIDYAFRDYDPFGAYGQSKTANVLFAVEVTRRWVADGITANALMPGGIHTNLQRHVGGEDYINRLRHHSGWSIDLKTPEQGAATSVLLAASPRLEGIGGRYFEDCHEAEIVDERTGPEGVARYAVDPGNAERLWTVSEELLAAS